jgi:gluconolactonase
MSVFLCKFDSLKILTTGNMMNSRLITSIILLIVSAACSRANESIIQEGATPVKVAGWFSFTEGPATDINGNVYFTDQPNDRILKWSNDGKVSTFMEGTGRSNGMFFDKKGQLITCADENNQLWAIDMQTLKKEVLLDNINGLKMNGPNDLWIDAKGGIYFTDPYYKRDYWADPSREIEKENVYYLLPDGNEVICVDSDLVKPNGIIGTPDGKTLYVADIGDNKTYRYTIKKDGSLSQRSLFCEMGSDGMTIDNLGNIYLTGQGVHVFNKKGEKIEHINIDEGWTANVTFGGKNLDILFITAMGSVYTLDMNVRGVR